MRQYVFAKRATLEEIMILKGLTLHRTPHTPHYYGFLPKGTGRYHTLLMSKSPGVDLSQLPVSEWRKNPNFLRDLKTQITPALRTLQEQFGLYHNDLDAGWRRNIMYDPDTRTFTVIDFGKMRLLRKGDDYRKQVDDLVARAAKVMQETTRRR